MSPAAVGAPPQPPVRVTLKSAVWSDVATLYIGCRGKWGSKWGNPHRIRDHGRDGCLKRFEESLRSSPQLWGALPELSGRKLACSCEANLRCHADVLIKCWHEVLAAPIVLPRNSIVPVLVQQQVLPPQPPERVTLKSAVWSDGATLYIGRGGAGLFPSKWGNPHKIRDYGREGCLARFEESLRSSPELWRALPELSGKKLECRCKANRRCHADVLIKCWHEMLAVPTVSPRNSLAPLLVQRQVVSRPLVLVELFAGVSPLACAAEEPGLQVAAAFYSVVEADALLAAVTSVPDASCLGAVESIGSEVVKDIVEAYPDAVICISAGPPCTDTTLWRHKRFGSAVSPVFLLNQFPGVIEVFPSRQWLIPQQGLEPGLQVTLEQVETERRRCSLLGNSWHGGVAMFTLQAAVLPLMGQAQAVEAAPTGSPA